MSKNDVLTTISTKKTPQREKARDDQVKNNAGGYAFQIGDTERLHRFLTLGTDAPTYYQNAKDLTRQNADVVFRMAATKPDELIAQILAVSEAGRAPKNKQAIFALAIAASAEDTTTRTKAMAVMHRICRTLTHLAQFNTYVEQFRGRGPSLNRQTGNWYKKKDVSKLAYQVTKYRSRDDWSHRDLLRLVKGYAGKTEEISADRDALYAWVARGVTPERGTFPDLAIVDDFLELKSLPADQVGMVATIIERGHGVSWEMIPDHFRKSPKIWETLVAQGMPQTALMRNLPVMTNVFGGKGAWSTIVANQLQDTEKLVKGRVHPVNVLVAQRVYASGHSTKMNPKTRQWSNTWTPIRDFVDGLDAAFYNSYGSVEPAGGRILLALDVSGSMGVSPLVEYDNRGNSYPMPINAREISAALALVTVSKESDVDTVAFTSGPSRRFGGYANYDNRHPIMEIDLSPRRRLDDVINYVSGFNYGATDCALPFLWATQNKKDYDAVVIYTDNETWSGPIHVHQAATNYRNLVGHDVKLIAAAMTATDYSVVDPKDHSGLNVSGFDSAVPQLIADFAGGRL